MPHSRRQDQAVEAFSASRTLLTEAKKRAAALKMTKSGYYRYCLALELGYPPDQAREVADHGSIRQLRHEVAKAETSQYPRPSHPNQAFVFNEANSNEASQAISVSDEAEAAGLHHDPKLKHSDAAAVPTAHTKPPSTSSSKKSKGKRVAPKPAPK